MVGKPRAPETLGKVLERVTGISQDEQRALLAQVIANRKKLDACPGPHVFAPVPEQSTRRLATDWICTVCGGRESLMFVSAYRKGFRHAGGDPAVVTTIAWLGS